MILINVPNFSTTGQKLPNQSRASSSGVVSNIQTYTQLDRFYNIYVCLTVQFTDQYIEFIVRVIVL